MLPLKIKVCGLTSLENTQKIASVSPDLMGFIFYPPSPRFVGSRPDASLFAAVPGHIEMVAVTVDEGEERITSLAELYGFTTFQLHGNESPGLCSRLKAGGYRVIKALPADAIGDDAKLEAFREVTDLILLDTPTADFGGSGRKFNWDSLGKLPGGLEFFLSGGVGPGDCAAIRSLVEGGLAGVDINSRFEQAPGIKDVQQVQEFINCIRNE